ncbi:cysteine desulfurase NifS [Lujinxingia litoralis]|uniref:cysteine desulfurase n=1 Tax=Lujinxingia litoralis TaxID=2211119 RepID=A0A328C4J5_9DELT|nr:cysteine desulfurase family protein [Lujinxingia litoralis]RAL20671.1 cysteine desulfurase NifS [Lujinxingia litoralis]
MHDALERPLYLDHNATTPLREEVIDAMLPYLREHWGNPSSGHVYGRRAKQAVEEARAQVAGLLGASPDEIVFTSGGTEANHLAIWGAVTRPGAGARIVTSCVEHPAVARPLAVLEEEGAEVHRLGVDALGQVCPQQAREALKGGAELLTVMHANNETGVLQPIGELAEYAHRAGALVHSDAAQSVGKVAVDVNALGVDLLSVAGHKLYAPKGVGALYVRRGVALRALMVGAGHEGGLRPGTENVASIVGLGEACARAQDDLEHEAMRQRRLRDTLFELLCRELPGVRLNGHPQERLPNTLSVRFDGVSGDALLAATPEVAASTGSACHQGQTRASAVILAMGVPAAQAAGTLRLSLGRATTAEEVERAARALITGWKRCAAPRG